MSIEDNVRTRASSLPSLATAELKRWQPQLLKPLIYYDHVCLDTRLFFARAKDQLIILIIEAKQNGILSVLGFAILNGEPVFFSF